MLKHRNTEYYTYFQYSVKHTFIQSVALLYRKKSDRILSDLIDLIILLLPVQKTDLVLW